MTTIRDIADTYGLTMLDADAPLEIEVKACDVNGSKAHNQTECAIARAVKRQYNAQDVYVLRSTVWVNDGEHLIRYALPTSLQKEIVSFDRNADFRPGKYRLAKRTHNAEAHAAAQRRYEKKKREAKATPAPAPRREAQRIPVPKRTKPHAASRRATPPVRSKHETEGVRSPDLDRY